MREYFSLLTLNLPILGPISKFVYFLFAGVGYGFYSVSVPVVLQQYFKEKKSRAFGVMMSGIALGAIVWPLLSQVCNYHH